ncbi:coiled-coil domain-containing protein 22 homolog isoform X2 [Daktulosphaira vitifoliae]|uniref:coiled-coil domain-containing protein 22 homolog isoform X2 n=1 Tax=Daktulosphaira vitifoliae TaxID=58002 RepID=UPI0021AA3472|nr:coiled-coil domain-containing protein 22 homolog isoform X2 [Daktulosphaira vitifoliae]
MEEIDSIIFFSLKGIGCNFSENETSLSNLSQETFIKAVIMCLRKIQPTLKLSNTIPRSMSARYQFGITVAEACKNVGYKSDIGYQTILYGSIVDVRRILMYLIENLPKETENIVESKSKRYTIIKTLKQSFHNEKDEPTVLQLPCHPFVSVSLETGITVPGFERNCSPAEWRHFCINELKFITEQLSDLKYLIPSIITLNKRQLLHIYRDRKNDHASCEENVSTNKLLQKHEYSTTSHNVSINKNFNINFNSSNKNDKQIENQMSDLENLLVENDTIKKAIGKQTLKYTIQKSELELLQKNILILEKSSNIIHNPEIIQKLKSKIETFPEKMEKMKNKWNLYEGEQKSILTNIKEKIAKKKINNDKLLHEVEKLRLQTIFEEIKKKEDLIKLCKTEFESKSNYNSRSSYTQRILEIITNIGKQKKDINKNLYDTRLVQKDINTLDGKVERCFISIDELIFKVAKKDDTIRKCYKLLAAIHANSSSIVQSVKQTGAIRREIKDLEEQNFLSFVLNISRNLC